MVEPILTPMEFDVDLSEATQTEAMPNILVQGDERAYELIVHVVRDGEPVSLTGASVIGQCMLPGNVASLVEGTAAGNTARVVLTSEFFSKKGKLTVMVTVIQGDVQFTVFSGVTNVIKSALSSSLTDTKAFPAAALIEAARNEQERITAEAIRQLHYEELQEVARDARDVVRASRVVAREEDDGYVEVGSGVIYDAKTEVDRIDLELGRHAGAISEVAAGIAATNGRVDEVAGTISSINRVAESAHATATKAEQLVNAKQDRNMGKEHAGKVLVVTQEGMIGTSGETTFLDELVTKAALRLYPVGSLYWNDRLVDPGAMFGGTWERIKSRAIVAADEDSDMFAPGVSGGSLTHAHTLSTHTMTEAELVQHAHPVNFSTGSIYSSTGDQYMLSVGATSISPNGSKKGESGTNKDEAEPIVGHTHTASTESNLMPYTTAYCWKRIS